MLSFPSTVTIGTLRSMSRTVFVFASTSSATLYVILSVVIFTSGFWATTSTMARCCTSSFIYKVSRFTRVCPAREKGISIGARPTEEIRRTKLPRPFTGCSKRPSISVVPIETACLRSVSFSWKMRSVANGSPMREIESSSTPQTLASCAFTQPATSRPAILSTDVRKIFFISLNFFRLTRQK